MHIVLIFSVVWDVSGNCLMSPNWGWNIVFLDRAREIVESVNLMPSSVVLVMVRSRDGWNWNSLHGIFVHLSMLPALNYLLNLILFTGPRAQPVIPPNVLFMNIILTVIAWGLQVKFKIVTWTMVNLPVTITYVFYIIMSTCNWKIPISQLIVKKLLTINCSLISVGYWKIAEVLPGQDSKDLQVFADNTSIKCFWQNWLQIINDIDHIQWVGPVLKLAVTHVKHRIT